MEDKPGAMGVTPIQILFNNRHNLATLSVSSSLTPPENTQKSAKSFYFRTRGKDEEWLEAKLPNAEIISTVIIYGHNISPGGTVRVQFFLAGQLVGETGPSAVADLIPLGRFRVGIDPWGGLDLSGLSTASFEASIEAQPVDTYRIIVKDPTNESSYISIGRVLSGFPYSPPKSMNLSYGMTMKRETVTRKERTEGLSLKSIGKGEWRKLTFDFNHLTDDEFETISKELIQADDGTEVFINAFPGAGGVKEAVHSFIAMREDGYSHTNEEFDDWKIPLVYVEV